METRYADIGKFITACDNVIGGKFMVADTKIGDILKAIASSAALTNLFTVVTDGFDYPAAKRAYLRFPAEAGSTHGAAYLPTERTEILAFVFCLLVELDEGSMKLNDFLLRYFYEDGSYTASYEIFTERMLRPFRDIVAECFPESKRASHGWRKTQEEDQIGTLSQMVSLERARIAALSLAETERAAAETVLCELYAATGRWDVREIQALVCGYDYLLRFANAQTEESAKLIDYAKGLS